jgi:hypothetical protein
MTDKDKRRRKSILTTIAVDPGITVARLRTELEMTHNIAASADLIRADLTWLVEMSLCRWDGEIALCTERGKDVAAGRAKYPGDV